MTIDTALAALTPLLGDRLSCSKSDLESHGQSESHFPANPPDAVAWPVSTEEVSEILKSCQAHGCPVVPFGGAGTSLEGHTSAIRGGGGVSLDFSRMNRVLSADPGDMIAVVQPGLTREALNEELRTTGMFFSVDPGANATIGGMAATRASGTTAVRYGTMRDNVLALEVVLADGRVIRTGSRAAKSSAGYDLTGLFVGGSEGTLGVITELTVRLQGQPEAISAGGVCAFDRLEDAVGAVQHTIQMGIPPMARIEFVDTMSVKAVNAHSDTHMPEIPHLLVEFHGSDSAVAEQAEVFGEIARDFGAVGGFESATKTEDRNRLWRVRHQAYYACLGGLRPGARAIVTDICVPISKLARAVAETRADIDASHIPPARSWAMWGGTAISTQSCWSIRPMRSRWPRPGAWPPA